MNIQLKQEVDELLYLMLENAASPEQVARMDRLMESDPEVLQYSIDFHLISAALRKSNIIPASALNTSLEIHEQVSFLNVLAREEREAPTVEVSPSCPDKPAAPLGRVIPIHSARTINRASLVTAIVSIAALVIMIAAVTLIKPFSREPVATLVQSLHAQWAVSSDQYDPGDSLYRSKERITLTSGIVSLKFHCGTEAVIEGPSVFSCISTEQLQLHSGRVYVRVPAGAEGFSVSTANSRIIDLGTEFGVYADPQGKTHLHLFKGKASLIASGPNTNITSLILSEGQANQVDSYGYVQPIPFDKTAFVRQIHPQTQFVWRGEPLSLADMAGGGNGFGTAAPNTGIDLKTGILVHENSERRGQDSKGYIPVSELPFVDGVFVPVGFTPVQLTSQGHTYEEFGNSNAQYYIPVGPYQTVNMYFSGENRWQNDTPLFLKGCEGPNYKSLCLHANAGITFDLQAIRHAYPFITIKQFRTLLGVSKVRANASAASDFYVFVNGQVRFVKKEVSTEDTPFAVVVRLESQDRFLTLVCMEGKENVGDWSLFVNPVLDLELN